jgi:hypothetical protein
MRRAEEVKYAGQKGRYTVRKGYYSFEDLQHVEGVAGGFLSFNSIHIKKRGTIFYDEIPPNYVDVF